MEATIAFLVVSVAHSLILSASCHLLPNGLSFTSTSANPTLPVNKTSLVNTNEFRCFRNQHVNTKPSPTTTSGRFGRGQIRIEIFDFGSLFQFDDEADVDEVIAAATLDSLHHAESEMMPKVAYRAGPGGGRGVVLELEPVSGTENMTWGVWRSVLAEITAYYGRLGKMPIDFCVRYIIESRTSLIGGGSLVHDLWGEGYEV